MAAEVTTAASKASRAEIIGFDTESGLGLLRAAEPLERLARSARRERQ